MGNTTRSPSTASPDAAALLATSRAAGARLRAMSVRERLAPISRLKQVILEKSESIIDKVQEETRKSRSDAIMSEIFAVLDHLAYLEKFAPKVLRDRKAHTSMALMGKKSWVYFEPMGTVLVISPWNYPFYQAIVPITSAFVCGNAVVYKPSEHTPLKGLVESLLREAGFEQGSVQVAYGDGAVAEALIDARPAKIFFTGSVRTGKRIMERASRNLTPVELELGGKDPMIVFADADLERAAAAAAWGAMTNTGQSCTSIERLYVEEPARERFMKLLLDAVSRIRIGVDKDGGSDMGEMTTEFQVRTVKEHLDDALSKGAAQLTGKDWDGRSRRIPPIVLDRATHAMKAVTEETFGPLLPVLSFRTEEEAVRLANSTEYGLAAAVWSGDRARAERVARALECGNVSVNNVMLTEGNHALPFGGVKSSGFGRYKGEFGLYSFSNVKSVLYDGNRKMEPNWYPYTPEKYRLFDSMMRGLFGGSLVRFALSGMKLESYSDRAGRKGR